MKRKLKKNKSMESRPKKKFDRLDIISIFVYGLLYGMGLGVLLCITVIGFAIILENLFDLAEQLYWVWIEFFKWYIMGGSC